MKKQPQWLTIATLRDGMLSSVQRLYYEDMLRGEMAEFLNQEHGSGNWIITPTYNLPESFDPATYTIENGHLLLASDQVLMARKAVKLQAEHESIRAERQRLYESEAISSLYWDWIESGSEEDKTKWIDAKNEVRMKLPYPEITKQNL